MSNYYDHKLIEEVSATLLKKLEEGTPLAALPETERVVACINAAQGVIDNGGLAHFFGNDWPDNPPYSVFIDAYRAIGVDAVADSIAANVAAFRFPDPHRNCEARQAWL